MQHRRKHAENLKHTFYLPGKMYEMSACLSEIERSVLMSSGPATRTQLKPKPIFYIRLKGKNTKSLEIN